MKKSWCFVKHSFLLSCLHMSQVPIFFQDTLPDTTGELELQQDTAKHVVQVLRMQQGGRLALTNGSGLRAEAVITQAHKRHCSVMVEEVSIHPHAEPALHLAVAFTKNTNRNEWLLEKVTELGVTTIIPMQSARSEREKFRYDRFRNILVAAMLQSQQYHLPDLRTITPLSELVNEFSGIDQKLVAHCMPDIPRGPILDAVQKGKETLLLIGPEGDFSDEEVKDLTSKGYAGISMGSNRLRTETAAVNACSVFNMINHA